MMSFFSRSTKTRLGIDIGTASIKVVELTKDSNRFALTNYGLVEMEPGDEKLLKLSNQDVVSGIKEILYATDNILIGKLQKFFIARFHLNKTIVGKSEAVGILG